MQPDEGLNERFVSWQKSLMQTRRQVSSEEIYLIYGQEIKSLESRLGYRRFYTRFETEIHLIIRNYASNND
jgi:hypothetical protein